MMDFKKILITTDLSENSKAALRLAAEKVDFTKSVVTLFTIIDDKTRSYEPGSVPSASQVKAFEEQKAHVHDAEQAMKKMGEEIFKTGNFKTRAIASDNPLAEEIVKFARENYKDLIIMSSEGKGKIKSFFLGSVVEKVIFLAACPVLIAPAAG